jgi:hypothetical protein
MIDRDFLRNHGVLTPEVQKVLIICAKQGGEAQWHPHNYKPDVLDAAEATIAQGLVQIIERVPHGLFIRLTDKGRYALDQMMEMRKQSDEAAKAAATAEVKP